jgi:hypothetical protein
LTRADVTFDADAGFGRVDRQVNRVVCFPSIVFVDDHRVLRDRILIFAGREPADDCFARIDLLVQFELFLGHFNVNRHFLVRFPMLNDETVGHFDTAILVVLSEKSADHSILVQRSSFERVEDVEQHHRVHLHA